MKNIRKITLGIVLLFCALLIYRLIEPPEMETTLIARKKVRRGFVRIKKQALRDTSQKRREEPENLEVRDQSEDDAIALQVADFEKVEAQFARLRERMAASCEALEQLGEEPMIDPNDKIFQNREEVEKVIDYILDHTYNTLHFYKEPMSHLTYFLNIYGPSTVIKAEKIRALLGQLDFCIVQKMQAFIDTSMEAYQAEGDRQWILQKYLKLAEDFILSAESSGNMVAGLGILKMFSKHGFFDPEVKEEVERYYSLVVKNQELNANAFEEAKQNSEKILAILDQLSMRDNLKLELSEFFEIVKNHSIQR